MSLYYVILNKYPIALAGARYNLVFGPLEGQDIESLGNALLASEVALIRTPSPAIVSSVTVGRLTQEYGL
jgi:hypothetical protein